jgi:leader peptidase (prepilin peptidase)/N-methyltransferase
MELIPVFILGAVAGSFLNVCIHRLPRRESVIAPGSRCTSCVKPIPWHDNIPVLSYILLKGKCRFCGTRISLRYPIVELLSALVAGALYLTFGPTPAFFAYAVMAGCLIVATFVDLAIQEIPDEVSVGGFAAGLVIMAIFPQVSGAGSHMDGFLYSLAGAATGAGSIYMMGFFGELVFKKEAMGGGDVKLMAMIGSFIGWKLALFTFFVAPLFGAVVGIALKIKDGREIIPYGPYLSLAAAIAVFWGKRVLGLLF